MLIQREHGAYGQLLMPLVVAFAVGGPAVGGLAWATAAASAFLAHEPLIVVLGQRGGRASREQSADARRSLLLFGVVAVLAGGLAVALLPQRARVALVVPVGLALVAAALVAYGRERTTVGEALIALTLTSVSFPTVMAGGGSVWTACTVVAAFAAAFVSATMAVRALIGHSTRSAHGPRRMVAAAVIVLLLLALSAVAYYGVVASVAIWAAAPACIVALALLESMPAPRHLRRIGWTLVGATAAAAVVLITALR